MAWTLHYQPIRNPRADDAPLTLGRALYISNAFEDKCRYVLPMINLIEKINGDPVLKLEEAIAQVPKDKMLDPTLQRLGQLLPVAGEQAEVLAAARRARNYIAHEGGLFSIHSSGLAQSSALSARSNRSWESVTGHRQTATGDCRTAAAASSSHR